MLITYRICHIFPFLFQKWAKSSVFQKFVKQGAFLDKEVPNLHSSRILTGPRIIIVSEERVVQVLREQRLRERLDLPARVQVHLHRFMFISNQISRGLAVSFFALCIFISYFSLRLSLPLSFISSTFTNCLDKEEMIITLEFMSSIASSLPSSCSSFSTATSVWSKSTFEGDFWNFRFYYYFNLLVIQSTLKENHLEFDIFFKLLFNTW